MTRATTYGHPDARPEAADPPPSGSWRDRPAADISVDLVVPVLNEAHVLEASIARLHRFLSDCVPYRWRIVTAENGSTDGTGDVARRLCAADDRLQLVAIGVRGRGRALRAAWTGSRADIVSYTDVDLSTHEEALPRLYDALIHGQYDLAVASRLLPESRTTRSFKRQVISHAYNWILRRALGVGFSDAQTGCKAVTREVVDRVLPLVENDHWFFDSELLVLAERLGYRIADIPVEWTEDHDTRVKIVPTAWEDVLGIARLHRRLRQCDSREFTLARSQPPPDRPRGR